MVVAVVVGMVALLLRAAPGDGAGPVLKTETFDRDPGWDHANNRPADRKEDPVSIRQDFGYSRSSHAGSKPGEIGGFLQAAAEPAFYGKDIGPATLDQPLTASGTLSVADGGTHLLLGFFNAGTANEWRTPNTVALRINGRGDHFLAYLEYCTSRWRAGGDGPQSFPTAEDPRTGRKSLVGFPSGGKVHRWSLAYDPKGNNGAGVIQATIDDATAVCNLDPAHRADGAAFNRFGLLNVMKSADGGTEVYLDDVTINGRAETFDADPKWDAKDNHKSYRTTNVRPRFDFGYSPTRFAGGTGDGEIGGLFFRGDCRHPARMAYYADRVGPLTLDKPIHASGRLVMRRGVTDSTTTFGFFNVESAMRSNPSQADGTPEGIIGFNIEGPSREGFCFYPISRPVRGRGAAGLDDKSPHVYPDAKPRTWTFDYDPAAANGRGRITVTLDGHAAHLDLQEADKASGTTFDRFGLITPWIDGNGQNVYFDDLKYTAAAQ